MMHRAWCCLEEVPYCFSRSSVKFQCHTAKKKSSILTQIGRFRTVTSVWIHWWLWNDPQCLKQHRRGALLFFKVNCRFWPELSVSGLLLHFEFTHGFEMMHKAWCSIEKVPYSFPRSSIKFEGHTGRKMADFHPNWAFPDCNFSLNSPMALKRCTKLDVVKKRCPIVFKIIHRISRSHRTKNQFWPEWRVSGL